MLSKIGKLSTRENDSEYYSKDINLCPKGCGPVIYDTPYKKRCKKCNFQDESSTPFEHNLVFSVGQSSVGAVAKAALKSGEILYSVPFPDEFTAQDYVDAMNGIKNWATLPGRNSEREEANAQIGISLSLFKELIQLPKDWEIRSLSVNWYKGYVRVAVVTKDDEKGYPLTIYKGDYNRVDGRILCTKWTRLK